MKYLLLYLYLLPVICLAQKFTISGYVKDKRSGENMIGASVFNVKTTQGTTTNNYGFYSLTLTADSALIRFSYVGHQNTVVQILLTQDTVLNVELDIAGVLQEIVIEGNTEEAIQNTTRMGTIDVPIEQINKIPALLGETDVMKVLQLLPGVQGGTEGSSGLYVRGGGPDQNLILLDGVPVYNASHLFGFFSVFNSNAINHVELIKGGFPARFGGRLSSVIDISMKEGNLKEFKGEGSIGVVASRITLEGPIKKDQTSFIVSARRTYIDILSRPIIQAASQGDIIAGYYFYDLNAKVNHKVDDRNRLYLSAYLGNDKAYSRYKDEWTNNDQHTSYEDEFGLRWGNITTALRWNRIVNKKLFSNLTATYSRYRFDVFADFKETIEENGTSRTTFNSADYESGIRDYALKLDFDYLPGPTHFVKFGGQAMQHLFTPGVFSYQSNEESDTTFGANKIFAKEFYAYLEDDIHLSQNLKINVGIHGSGFLVNNKLYHSIQPRVAARYLLSPAMSLKVSYAQMTQYLHLLTNAGLGLPTDLWVPATEQVKPEQSYLYSIGFAYNLNSKYEFSIEGYYKEMTGLIEYKEGASYVDIENDWQTKVTRGNGESYGSEFFVQKKTGKFSGWIGYTLAWNYRTFPEIDEGRRFPYKYDRRHDIEIALVYELSEKKDLSLTWVYGTGAAISLPNDTYAGAPGHTPYPASEVQHYDGRNNYRMKAYHRMDISYSIKKKTKYGERTWSFALYNAYSRKNPFFMDINYTKDGEKKFIQYSLFPIIPSAAVHFKF
jgi:outer membrane receptor for ferrienterochelin and colicin